MAMGRAMDDVIIAAASATAYTGETGSTTVAATNGYRRCINWFYYR
jgi:hypothetical protein